MFDFVRTHTKWIMFFLVVLIIPSFVFFGVQGYTQFGSAENATVAKVDGQKITQGEWNIAHQRRIEQLRQQNPGIDAKLLDAPELKRETLEQLVRERVLFTAAARQHLVVSDERLQRELFEVPQLAALKRPDGSIDVPAYKALLEAQGMTPEIFEARVRQQATLAQVTGSVEDSALASQAAARAVLDALLQRRDVQLRRFEVKDYLAKVNPTDADLAAYHKANEAQFRTTEQARIEYVTLGLDNLMAGVTVGPEDLRKYYDENISRYTSAEERRASHILVKADKEMPADQRSKAKAKAEGVLAELRKNPGAFAELAKKNSDDPGSAERGGDLDFFGRGAMVKPFEDAVYAMKQGEISNLVESDFGFHIIRLDAVRGGERKAFDAVRAEIETQVKRQLAQAKYAEAAEQFCNTVYEQADSLQPVIDRLKLTKQTATVARTPAPAASGVLASAKLLDAVFADDTLRNKRNTEAVETAPNQLTAARVIEHLPARVLPLAEARPVVLERVRLQQALALARKDGEAVLAQARQAADAGGLPAAITVSRADPQTLSAPVLDGVLRADAAKLPVAVGIDDGQQAYVVARITAVQPPAAQAPELAALSPRIAQAWARAESQAYYEALKARYKVELNAPASAASATP
jgi:peptidyl-prolyl cis-trans isomerase D